MFLSKAITKFSETELQVILKCLRHTLPHKQKYQVKQGNFAFIRVFHGS